MKRIQRYFEKESAKQASVLPVDTNINAEGAEQAQTKLAKLEALNKIDDDTVPVGTDGKPLVTSICVDLWQLPIGMMMLKSIYKALRILYLSVWFYFLPFLALLGSYIVPYYYQRVQSSSVL